jgi:hypothetical protein
MRGVARKKELEMKSGLLTHMLGYAALGLYVTMAAEGSPLHAQDLASTYYVPCQEARLAVPGSVEQVNGNLTARILTPPASFIVEADTQTLTGRLACADPRPAFYNCGHTKQSVWGCKPDCLVERNGSQFVLQTSIKSYSLTGDQNELRPLLKDRVIVTGEVKGNTMRVLSITKAPKKDNPERALAGTTAP